MSDYEFWNELGNIFNAVVAYQRKTIEFNKRFVNPWIKLGTVFDQKDQNAASVQAYRKAIEIDPENPSNWLALGDAYFKMSSLDDAVDAYNKAIEMNPKFGWAYANLALTFASQQKYEEAINLFVKSLDFIPNENDRAIIWNRLGNVYRKVNDYNNAFIAFQKADEFDAHNTGFQDTLDEVTVEQMIMPVTEEAHDDDNLVLAEPMASEDSISEAIIEPVNSEAKLIEIEQPLSESSVEESVGESNDFEKTELLNFIQEIVANELGDEDSTTDAESLGEIHVEQVVDQEAISEEIVVEEASTEAEEISTVVEESLMAPIAEILENVIKTIESQAVEEISTIEETANSELSTETTVTPVVLHVVETIANPSELNESVVVVDENLDESLLYVQNEVESVSEMIALETEVDSEVQNEAVNSLMDAEIQSESEVSTIVEESSEVIHEIEVQESDVVENGFNTIVPETVAESDKSSEPAYDAFMKQSAEPEPQDEPVEVLSQVNLKVEPDSRNAHVWNELGNVYFNTGSLDEAISVYSKAIELDDCFAWPYSNLALAYVQREKYAEAILLYQRSIELFVSDQDKAITWNRLGNVYRRLNDYDNAIVCYQRADELDPNNATRSLRSRYSLLGSLNMEQVSSLVV